MGLQCSTLEQSIDQDHRGQKVWNQTRKAMFCGLSSVVKRYTWHCNSGTRLAGRSTGRRLKQSAYKPYPALDCMARAAASTVCVNVSIYF